MHDLVGALLEAVLEGMAGGGFWPEGWRGVALLVVVIAVIVGMAAWFVLSI